MVLVSSVALQGTTAQIGGVTPEQLAYVQSTVASQQTANGGTPAASSVGIPDNFWGFIMLTMGLR